MYQENKPMVKIYLLGSFSMKVNNRNISAGDWKSRKALAIFKYLVSHYGKKIQKDILMELLWPDSSRDQIHNLHTTVYYARKILDSLLGYEGKEIIKSSKGLYWFDKPSWCWLDIEEFDSNYKTAINLQEETKNLGRAIQLFKKAITLYQNDLLDEDLYNDWTFNLRQHYRELYIDAVLRGATLLIDVKKDYLGAVQVCQQGLEIDPYREELYRSIISNLLKAGMYVEAIKMYHKYSRMLHEEFGLKPGPVIKDMFLEYGNFSKQEVNILDAINTESKARGSFFCKRQVFDLIYELQLRRQKRTGEVFALMTIEGKRTEQQKKLLNILQSKLREGDVICHWNPKTLLLMLYQTGSRAAKKIKNRLEEVLSINNINPVTIKFSIIKGADSSSELEKMII